MKKTFLLFLMLLFTVMGFSQERTISGKIQDRDTSEPLVQTTVQLLKMDSTFVTGAVTNEDGLFTCNAPVNGKYLLKISSIGYKTVIKHVAIVDDKNLAMGKIVIGSDAIMLKGATVTGMAAKVVVKEDTFVYNSAAYRTPEGSVIEELVRRLPGAEIDSEGNVTINGKQVKKIKVDGKEFMTGDTKTALKNLPTSIVDNIKAYDEKSDLAKVTGIDDGEESTVLDFGLKKGMNKGLFGNVDMGAGTEDRYTAKMMGAYFNSTSRFMMFGSANNVNDMGFGGGRGGNFGRGLSGLTATKMVGMNYNFEKKDKFQFDASVRWNHSNNDAWSKTSSENFVNTTGAFSNSKRQSYSRSNSWNGNMRIEWQPDTMTNIMFRPSFTLSSSDGVESGSSASFNSDPYLSVTDPLDEASLESMAEDSIVVNSQQSQKITYSDSKNVSGMLQINRKLSSNGRNVTLRADAGYSKSDSKSLSVNATRLWLLQNQAGEDSTYQTNRYNLVPTRNKNYTLQATYSEPLFKGAFLQLRYQFKYQTRKSDRSTYDFSDYDYDYFSGISPKYRQWDNYLGLLDNSLDSYLDADLSKYAEYKNYIHQIDLTFRLIQTKFRLSAGFMVQPQQSKFIQNYLGVNVDTTRNVTNFSPTLDFRYKFNKQHQLRINYRGTTTQPSMSDLLDITDDSNPLNISKGNPGLKPSFTQNLNADYRNYIQKHMRFIFANLGFSTTSNSISSKVTYNDVTGGRVTQPENINGNWNVNGRFTMNTAIDTTGYWNVNTATSAEYSNNVGYLALDKTSGSVKNTVKNTQLSERLGGSYRNSWLELELNGSVTYNHARNQLQPTSDLDTWQFTYGADANITLPWGMTLSSDIHMNSRRGYNESSMNTNEMIWNAQVGQGFLKGKALTLTLQFYDILKEQSNFSRAIFALSRTDTEYNAINSYAMLHVIYRVNVFGNKDTRREMRENGRRPNFNDPNMRGGTPPEGGPRGNGGDGPRGGGGGFGGPMQ